VFALYARESDGHLLVASLLVPLDQLLSGLPFRAWVQLVCIGVGIALSMRIRDWGGVCEVCEVCVCDGDVDSGDGIL
jgi:hypothetical protein